MKKQRYLDVIEYTPKENGEFIERIAKRELATDKGAVILFLFLWQTSLYGFFQFLPKDIYLFLSLLAVLYGGYMLVLILTSGFHFGLGDDSYIGPKQKDDLVRLAAINKNVGRYLFLLKVSGRPAYVAEYKQLMKYGLDASF